MNDINLDAIRARAEAATEGPWETVPTIGNAVLATCDDGYWRDVADQIETEVDAEFIAASRTDVPALLAEVEALRAQIEAESDVQYALRTDRARLAATVDRVESMIPELEADIPEDNGNATAHHIAKGLRAAIEGTDS